MIHRRLTCTAALGLTLAAIAAPAASAQQDLRSPDARDAAAAAEAGHGQAQQDFRSPDARDAAQGRGTFNAPEVTVVKVAEPSQPDGGTDWTAAGIGAGGMLGLVCVGLGGTVMVTRRRHGRIGRGQAVSAG